ncbi:hypothetical protein GCM10011511_35990 [Puia dinghuensis]|uniref:Uncharacterized protein n=2 Tax=Puia dinghuensis TaxID=1792502 RepID=A0A8J2UF65_9BACT|nr:hypothetical protein GCM10011511_35990 [Puia dinghuensis]
MEWESYDLEKDLTGLAYDFVSEGPKGRIKKLIRFQPVPSLGTNVYNVALGDLDEANDRLNDSVISNNGDRLKVLNTVADAIIDFLLYRPTAIILLRATTLARTRLYQIGITFFWAKLNSEYEIWGKIDKDWIPFRAGPNYQEFLLFKKME